MHPEARAFVERHLLQINPELVLEFGSLNINGQVRDILPGAVWHGIDLQPGPGVDEVADALHYTHPFRVEVVVCCEVLEHTPWPEQIVGSAVRNLCIGGHFLMTCAIDNRAPHSGFDGGPLRPEEYYGNVQISAVVLACERNRLSLVDFQADFARGDLYVAAVKR